MGSICSNQVEDQHTFNIRKMDTGSLDLENHNPLLDHLVTERYKCSVRINAKVKGFLFRKKFRALNILTKIQQIKKINETEVSFEELLPESLLADFQIMEKKLFKNDKFIELSKKIKEESNLSDFNSQNKNIYTGNTFYSGQFSTEKTVKTGYGRIIRLKNNNHEKIINDFNNKKSKEDEVFQFYVPQLSSNDINYIDLGLFSDNKLTFGMRMISKNNFYVGTFASQESESEEEEQLTGEGDYYCNNYILSLQETNGLNTNNNESRIVNLRYSGEVSKGLFQTKGKLELVFYQKDKYYSKDSKSDSYEPNYDLRICYDGKFINGLINGQAKLTIDVPKNDKSIITTIEGKFIDGKLNGYAQINLPFGHTFKGEVQSNSFNGKGEYVWKSIQNYNQTYLGEYSNNIKTNGIYSFKFESLKSYNEAMNSKYVTILIYDGGFVNNQPFGDASLYVNKVLKDENNNKIVHEVVTDENTLILTGNFHKGKLQKLIKKNDLNFPEFDDFEMIDKTIVGNLKKEVLLDQENLKYMQIIGSVKFS